MHLKHDAAQSLSGCHHPSLLYRHFVFSQKLQIITLRNNIGQGTHWALFAQGGMLGALEVSDMPCSGKIDKIPPMRHLDAGVLPGTRKHEAEPHYLLRFHLLKPEPRICTGNILQKL